MALTQTGENQRKIGVNLSKIIGLKDNAEKLKAIDLERQRGGFNAVYFNGRNAGTESGGTDPTCTPCGGGNGGGSGSGGGGSGGGGGGSGGGGGGGGVIMPCQDEDCVTLAEAAELTGQGDTPCCIKGGKDCETGEYLPICLSDNCGNYGEYCQPPPQGVCTTAVIHFVWTGGESWKLTTLKKVASDINSGVEENFNKAVQNLGGGVVQDERTTSSTRTINCGGETYEISCANAKYGFVVGSGWANSNASFQNNPSGTSYNRGLENWTKPKGKYFKNGKFYDACGIEPQDCIAVCDENGNQYKICTKNGKPKVTPTTE